MTDKLKPCPFCGGEAEILHESVGEWYVRCKKCWCKTSVNANECLAIVRWNTRKPMDRIVEQLEAKAEDCRKCWDEFGDEDEISIMIGYKRAIEIVKGGAE